jgi:hypothetical protein
MAVGNNFSSDTVDQLISGYSVQMRNLMQNIVNLSTNVNGQANGLAFLEGIGYQPADAQTALNAIAYLNTIAGCYFGTVQQGGSDGTGATVFDFNQEMAQYWAGQ